MQGNGAEMLRLACCLAVEDGIKVCATVHDAVLIEAPSSAIDEAIKATQAHMVAASREVLGGFELRSDSYEVLYPDRYVDAKGKDMWGRVQKILGELEAE